MAAEMVRDGHCLGLARTVAAHYDGDNRLHDDGGRAHQIYQSSTMTALLDAVYDGGLTYGQLAGHGDFGVGTFNELDGEMIAVDGDFFQLRSDGTASPVTPDELTPFAAVTFFRGDAHRQLDGPMDLAAVEELLDGLLPSPNLFYAVRIDGRFSSVVTRTVARQHRPYRPLVEVTKTQTERTFVDLVGTIAGFRAPDYAQGLTVAGYHLHFIDQDRAHGGHVLDLTLEGGLLQVDQDADLHVELPETPDFLAADLDGRDVAAEVQAAEHQRRG
ncbi:MAG TPA: acetolactate decarboxylase [Acidimicrobiales bacterium]|nr:acetolactate decarboxylase [Acidimicrobiales bacterium]